MYDANTRATYAEMFKTAERQLPAFVRELLVKTAENDPALKAALVNSKETR